MNRPTDRRILKKFFVRISDSKGDFNRFPDPTVEVDCGFIQFWTLRVIKVQSFAGFRIQAEILTADWFINHNGWADLQTPIHPPPYCQRDYNPTRIKGLSKQQFSFRGEGAYLELEGGVKTFTGRWAYNLRGYNWGGGGGS